MADKAIGELEPAASVELSDLFVLEQTGTAKKLTGQILKNWLLELAQGHGGITNITYTAPVSPSLNGTLTITLADDSVSTFSITNGKGITSITWSESGTTGDGKTHTGTIHYNDGTTSTITFTDGLKGDQGDNANIFIKYSAIDPVSDSDMSDIPDDWWGVYSGTAQSAPTHYTDYQWYKVKGEIGNTGDPATLTSNTVGYAWSSSGSVAPESWSGTIPQKPSGSNFLWTRTILNFNTGDPVTFYCVSHYGEDGEGAVAEVNGVSPIDGNVTLTAADIQTDNNTSIQARISAIEANAENIDLNKPIHFSVASFSALPKTVTDSRITADMRVFNAVFSKPSELKSDITWTTSEGSVVFSGSMDCATELEFDLMKVN